MAKIAQTRFPDPPEQYDPRAFSELVRQLEQIVLQLNSSYQEDNKNEILRRVNFLQGDGNDQDGTGIALSDLSVNTGSASGGGSLSYNNTTGVFSFAPASVPAAVENTPSWFSKRSANQTVAHQVSTVLVCDQERFDTDSAYDTSTGRFTVPSNEGGKYFVYGLVSLTNFATNKPANIAVRKNGVEFTAFQNISGDYSDDLAASVSQVFDASVGDYFDIVCFHRGGSTFNANTNTSFGGFKLI